jgi:transposase InsO family protein
LLKEKNDVFDKFKEFKALVENLTKRKIKTLRLDNGGEFTSEELKEYCKDVEIKREISTSYNPQQNGIVERKNQTIMEAVKTMIHDQYLHMHLWVEAVKTTVYVQNKIPHKVLENNTLEEIFSREKPKVNHFRIFVYHVFVHVPKETRTKLDPFEQKGIFVGYSYTSKTYRICILGHRKVEINRDVTFDENAAFSKSK